MYRTPHTNTPHGPVYSAVSVLGSAQAHAAGYGDYGDYETRYSFGGDESTRDGVPADLAGRAALAIVNTPELLQEARQWCADVFEDGDDSELWAPASIVRVLSRNYDGGLVEFYLNSRALAPVITRSN